MRVLVVNAGSSTVKLSLIGDGDVTLTERELAAPRASFGSVELEAAMRDFGEPDVVGHRIVHGGERFREAVLIDAAVQEGLRELVALAPLHQPKSLAALDAVSAVLPEVPAIACFDTAFHATLPAAAHTYALPAAWRERWGLRRYGFHGLSHAWVARHAPEILREDPTSLRIVSCHLGAGASLCAIAEGRSLETTMGFTPLEGLVMATRSGSVDPGLLLWLMEQTGMTEKELAHVLEHESGLLGLAGTADMRAVLGRAADGDGSARLARDVYVHRLSGGIAAMAAALGGLDVLVFTGGVGERSPEIRARAAGALAFLGVAIDADANATARAEIDPEITASPTEAPSTPARPRARVLVTRAREDLEIARQARAIVSR